MDSLSPAPGQVWADNDPRCAGRTLRVDEVVDGKALCTILTNSAETQADLDRGIGPSRDMRGKPTRISVTRFKPTSTGYRLIIEAAVDGDG